MTKPALNPLVALWVCALLLLGVPATARQSTPNSEDDAVAPSAEESETTARDRRQQAKEARIEQYLQRREERRARRELTRAAAEPPPVTNGGNKSAPADSPMPVPTHAAPTKLPKQLARAQENVRASALGVDPTVQVYLARIDEQRASPEQLAAFGSFVAENGLVEDGLAYYDVALNLQPGDPLLWLNYGTLQRQNANISRAMSAYQRVLDINPNSAMAHYNIGAIHDSQRKYEAAIDSFSRALQLDPNLGDPALNPQAAQNERLLAVKLKLYRQQIGSLGLPLAEIPVPAAGEMDGGDDERP